MSRLQPQCQQLSSRWHATPDGLLSLGPVVQQKCRAKLRPWPVDCQLRLQPPACAHMCTGCERTDLPHSPTCLCEGVPGTQMAKILLPCLLVLPHEGPLGPKGS